MFDKLNKKDIENSIIFIKNQIDNTSDKDRLNQLYDILKYFEYKLSLCN